MRKVLLGFILGVAYVTPGVCSASIALSLGLYEDMLELFGGFYRWKILLKHRFLLLGVILGSLFSLTLFSYCYKASPALVLAFFGGFCFYGLIKEIKKFFVIQKETKKRMLSIYFVVGCFLVLILQWLGQDNINVHCDHPILCFLLFLFVSLCMLLPGVSGALFLLSFNLYYPIVSSFEKIIASLVSSQTLQEGQIRLILLFFSGILCGILLFSKILTFFLHRKPNQFQSFILGLIFGSMILLVFLWNENKVSLKEVFLTIPLFILGYEIMVLTNTNHYKDKKNKENSTLQIEKKDTNI